MTLVVGHSSVPKRDSVRLYTIFEKIIDCSHKLMDILQEEKRLIIEGDVEDLVCCLAKKEDMVKNLKTLEENRQKEISLLYPKNPNISLEELISLVPDPQKEGFRSYKDRLDALTASIQDVNQMNSILVDRVLHQITSLLGLLKQMSFHTITYQPSGLIYETPSGGNTIAKG